MSLYMHKPPIPNKIGLKSEVVTSNSEVTGSGIELNSGVSDVSTSIKDLELSSKYSNALVSSRKSLMRSDYKTQQQSGNGKFNPSEKRLNFPLTDFVHLEKFSKVYNNNNNNNNNGKSTDSNTSFLIRLPERHDFTASTASLIVHVPSLSYVSEQVDDDRSDNEFLRSDLSDSQRNRNCPICNILYTDLQQQFDEFHVKKSFSLSTINVNINDNTTATTNNENSSMHYMNTPRLWDILESFSANSSRNFVIFIKILAYALTHPYLSIIIKLV
ncbi:unnamed protein product [Heterobilharzia americana]|nr:unnamed protein product [Heterobilharzia americana]